MAISGHTAPQLVINSTSNVQNYSGNATVGSSSDLVIIIVQAWDANTLEDPANWTVTLGGGSALTASTTGFNTGIDFAVAVYEVTSPPTGTPAVAVDLGGAGRASQALVWVISGHDTTTPVAGRSVNTSYSSDVATQAFTRTTTANNNVLISMLGVRETVTTSEFSMTGGTLISAANTGTGDTSDITCAYGYHVVATAGSTTDTYNWTDTGRAHVAWVEINVATGSGVTGTLAATETGTDTAAASGTVAVSGSLTSTEAGSDTLAATGAVAVSGALAASETGADTFAGAGSTTGAITGSMSAQEAGSDTFAGVGAVVISGAVSAIEAGADVLAASGVVAVLLAMAVAEAGADAAAIVGSVSASGTMAATETGSDTFAASSNTSIRRARYPAASANTVTVHSETRQSAVIGTTRTVRIV